MKKKHQWNSWTTKHQLLFLNSIFNLSLPFVYTSLVLVLGFSHYMPGCVTGCLFPNTQVIAAPYSLVCDTISCLTALSATRPRNLHRAPSLGEDCSHTNGYWCPVLIRNVSQCLTASVSHSLKRGRKYSTSCLPPSLRFSHSVSHSRAACSYLNCHS